MSKEKKSKKEKYVPKKGIMGVGVDYSVYTMNVFEKIIYFIIAAVVSAAVGWIFYENVILSGILAVISGFVFVPMRRDQIIKKRKDKLLLQFKDMLESLTTSIGAGSNVQDAFKSAQKDMGMQYGEGSNIYKELEIINAGVANNINIEQMLLDMGDRTGIDDITNFANVFDTCYRKGGNIKDVLQNTYWIICDKIDIALEIRTMVAAKKSEQNAMMVMPIFFVFLLKMLGNDVINLTSPIGRISTTIAVVLFIVSYFIGKRILNIKL